MLLNPRWSIEFEDAEMRARRPTGLRGVNVRVARKAQELRDENQKLKQIVANLLLDKTLPTAFRGKKSPGAHQDPFIGEFLRHERAGDAERRSALLGHSAF
jgi:hypothetical protein